MTAVVEHPRTGHVLGDLLNAIQQRAADPDTAPYWSGYIVGFTATFTDDDVFTDALTDARGTMFAAAHNVGDTAARLRMFNRNLEPRRAASIMHASGVLYGWKQGTAERDDAAECVVCDARILTRLDDEAVECYGTGWFCDQNCHQSYDAGQCCAPEPEFDKDRYYERKHGRS